MKRGNVLSRLRALEEAISRQGMTGAYLVIDGEPKLPPQAEEEGRVVLEMDLSAVDSGMESAQEQLRNEVSRLLAEKVPLEKIKKEFERFEVDFRGFLPEERLFQALQGQPKADGAITTLSPDTYQGRIKGKSKQDQISGAEPTDKGQQKRAVKREEDVPLDFGKKGFGIDDSR